MFVPTCLIHTYILFCFYGFSFVFSPVCWYLQLSRLSSTCPLSLTVMCANILVRKTPHLSIRTANKKRLKAAWCKTISTLNPSHNCLAVRMHFMHHCHVLLSRSPPQFFSWMQWDSYWPSSCSSHHPCSPSSSTGESCLALFLSTVLFTYFYTLLLHFFSCLHHS